MGVPYQKIIISYGHCSYESVTDNYIEGIYLCWTIMIKVKLSNQGTRLHNKYATPIYYVSDEKYISLHKFSFWLDLWNDIAITREKASRETSAAL